MIYIITVDGYQIDPEKVIPVNMEVQSQEEQKVKPEIILDVTYMLKEAKKESDGGKLKPGSQEWYLDLISRKADITEFFEIVNIEVNKEKERIEEEKRQEAIRQEEKRRKDEEERRKQEEIQKQIESDRKRIEKSYKPAAIIEQKPKVVRESTKESGNWETYHFSAYYPADDALQGGFVTATGIDIGKQKFKNGHRILAGPPHLPFGTVVEVEVGGMRFTGIIEDRGGAIKGNRIDILMNNHREAYGFGRKTGKLRVIS